MTVHSAATFPRARAVLLPYRLSAAGTSLANAFERSHAYARVTATQWTVLLALVCLGGVLRFWGLAAHGLEYDEETMAMPVMNILEHGTPAMPSGMIYVRAVLQQYLMAASVVLFGPTEWALRLPSAICGLALIAGCFFLGRRFLAPAWNLAFVGVITLSSTMILDAQEARMYVFMVASLVWFNVLVFRWERTGQLHDLTGAVLLMAVAIQFHSLAVFGALPLLLPGLLQADRRRLIEGVVAFALVLGAFVWIHYWVESFFPPSQSSATDAIVPTPVAKRLYGDVALQFWPLSLLAIAAAVLCADVVRRRVADATLAWLACVCLAAGLCAQLFVLYHLAGLLLIAGAVAALRGGARVRYLLPVAVVSGAMLAMHLFLLHEVYPGSVRKLLGTLPGTPSIWPYFIFARYAPHAVAIVAVGALLALHRLVQRKRVDDVWLYGALAVWAPLFLIGAFTWYTQQRYTELALVPLLLCAMASLAAMAKPLLARQPRWVAVPVAAAACLLVANPLATASVVNAGYRIHPDHKGAAELVRALRGPDDIVLAEDVLQQTYYLGQVDYWLIGERTALRFTRENDGRRRDVYTHTPVMTSAGELDALIASRDRGAIYIIGSGEQHEDGRHHVRGPSLAPLLANAPWEVVYRGRDGLTRVWRIPAPSATAAAPAE